MAAMPADAQRRLDAAGAQACTRIEQFIVESRGGMLSNEQARQRLLAIYEYARTSGTPAVRERAERYIGQVFAADSTMLLLMAEEFRAGACR